MKAIRTLTLALLAALIAILAWAWWLVKRMLEVIGFSTVVDDAENLERIVKGGFIWLFNTPEWVPATISLVFSALLTLILVRSIKFSNKAETFIEDAAYAAGYIRNIERKKLIEDALDRLDNIDSSIKEWENKVNDMIRIDYQNESNIVSGRKEIWDYTIGNHSKFQHEADEVLKLTGSGVSVKFGKHSERQMYDPVDGESGLKVIGEMAIQYREAMIKLPFLKNNIEDLRSHLRNQLLMLKKI